MEVADPDEEEKGNVDLDTTSKLFEQCKARLGGFKDLE
jgi:hypothetical protein